MEKCSEDCAVLKTYYCGFTHIVRSCRRGTLSHESVGHRTHVYYSLSHKHLYPFYLAQL